MTRNTEPGAQRQRGTTQNHSQETELCPNQGMAGICSPAFGKFYGSMIAVCDAKMGWL